MPQRHVTYSARWLISSPCIQQIFFMDSDSLEAIQFYPDTMRLSQVNDIILNKRTVTSPMGIQPLHTQANDQMDNKCHHCH